MARIETEKISVRINFLLISFFFLCFFYVVYENLASFLKARFS